VSALLDWRSLGVVIKWMENVQRKVQTDGESEKKVTMNYRYVSDGIAATGSDKVVLHMIDGMNPVCVTPAEGEGYRYIVMPIRQ
jgi:DNA polymerase III sliding clamp (beta) subunit (PCNA family)